MIDNVSGEIIDDDGLKKISNDYKLGSLYDDSEDDYKYDAPDYEYADLKLEDEIIDSWYFWYNHDDKKKVTQVTGESKVEKKKGKKKK
ncbi:MAG: hypothetical protein IKE73_05460, partial [Bacilli bacterium]|nr:hypothetical protein [Bacilli bacterium]